MSLLAQVNQPNINGYYFALDSTPSEPVVTAVAFDATGTAVPYAPGNYAASVAPGYNALRISDPSGEARFGIAINNAEAGANSGSDFTINRYDDTGALLPPALVITRATGDMALVGNLSVAGDISSNTAGIATALTVGTPALIGGGALEVNGTAGAAQVYDNIYHRPNGGMEVINTTYGPTGVILTGPTYIPANTGTYSVTMEITADAAGYAWTNGVALIMGYFSSPFPPFPILSDGFLSCDSLANPTGIVLPTGGGGIINNVYKKDIVAIVTLQQGVAYAAQISSVGGFNLGTTGGIAFYIQPLLA